MQDQSFQLPSRIGHLSDVSRGYEVIFCDIWGVVHNGVVRHAAAEAALSAARAAGAKVVLVTNAPRQAKGVIAQLDGLSFARDAYDAVVTSGDVTRALIAKAGGPVFHIGPARDVDLFEGLDVTRTDDAEAATAVIATGLFDDTVETPDDYRDLLAGFRARALPMICANPDIVVHRGETLIYCAGALAKAYEAAGGTVLMAGKPYAPIYAEARRISGASASTRILAIGDGLNTDIKGANGVDLDVLLITGGIHGSEFGETPDDPATIATVLAERGLKARFFMAALG
ncbi:TIGR01459 family HAD-type hydrolase [Jiella sp. MQZ9-1]|uniref:TIGR01459 family HAD-type hydrolase n=1 Tax=Jiella flava TaxID=2816857 RepID=A0A939FWM9_9HYPH|nr:TIGR01459 family HAD-type hydrolase [Jiella flava]MBO0662116.1 TIGR01459 family HAD-type hydrolase [Jiella flava]MCD2470555.1 TIGR01459 family HAD-type hydrolase [Jiella flava]